MDLSPQSIENTVQRITLKDTSPSMSCIPEPAIQLCDNGQWSANTFFDSWQLTKSCMSNIKLNTASICLGLLARECDISLTLP